MFTCKEYRKIARNKLSGHWLISILVSFVAALLGGLGGSSGSAGSAAGSSAGSAAGSAASGASGSSASADATVQSFTEIIGDNPVIIATILSVIGVIALISLVLFFIGGAVELGHNSYYINLCQNGEPGFDTLFSRFNIFFKALGLRLFMGLFILLWFMLFFIPGIIAAYRYSMAPYIMAQDPNVGIREAVNRSKEMMAGRKWKYFCLHLSFIGWAILCLFTLGIGALWLNPYISPASAAFYLDISGQGIPLDPQAV